MRRIQAKKKIGSKLSRFLRFLYLKLFRLNDTPHRIALGIGVGVFSGIMPGTGAIAAFTLAVIFRFNRAAALLGSLLTNTWLSVVTFMLALKIGSRLFGVSWHDLQLEWNAFLKGFHWVNLFKASVLKMIVPVIAGYSVIATVAGICAYIITICIVLVMKSRKGFKP